MITWLAAGAVTNTTARHVTVARSKDEPLPGFVGLSASLPDSSSQCYIIREVLLIRAYRLAGKLAILSTIAPVTSGVQLYK